MINDKNKVIAITGTSGGIGLEIVKYYLSLGFKVAGCARSDSNFEHNDYLYENVDIKEEKQVRSWVQSIKKKYKRIDILVCNAGLVKSSLTMPVTSTNILQDFMDVHIKGTFITCREVSKIMLQQRHGRIINISSINVPLLQEGTSAYSGTKAAIETMSKIFAKELAPIGITCNVISPGLIDNEVTKTFSSEWKKKLIDKQTIKSALKVDDLCYIINFLIGSKSNVITGQVINMGLVN